MINVGAIVEWFVVVALVLMMLVADGGGAFAGAPPDGWANKEVPLGREHFLRRILRATGDATGAGGAQAGEGADEEHAGEGADEEHADEFVVVEGELKSAKQGKQSRPNMMLSSSVCLYGL